MNIQKTLKKFTKMGAVIVEGYLDDSWKVTLTGKSIFIDETDCWTEYGYDNASQETSRRFFDNPTQAAKWLLRK